LSYPVSFGDFMKIKATGNYVIMYCILPDRVHLEMAVENAIYLTQKFLLDIENELASRAVNYEGDSVLMFLKTTLTDCTFYRYWAQNVEELMDIRMYNKLVVVEKNSVTDLDPGANSLQESEKDIRIMNNNQRIMVAAKQVD
jgi:hypothetical protein